MNFTAYAELEAAKEKIIHLEKLVASLQCQIEILQSQNSYSKGCSCTCSREAMTPESRETLVTSISKNEMTDVQAMERAIEIIEGGPISNSSLDAYQASSKPLNRKSNVSEHPRRHIALKIMYLGARFHGFASDGSTKRTVESELFKALEKTKLMIGGPVEARYTRCGRTDKGVSANGQVIALLLRSHHKDLNHVNSIPSEDRLISAVKNRCKESEFSKLPHDKDINYVGVLNRALPVDIRVLGWCYVPETFHARFSCLWREYNYFFINFNLDIEGMKYAAGKFKGKHDFRNFCKMDAENIHSFQREILSFDIVPCDRWYGLELWMFRVQGTAFLWHQVRCMVAVLFMIGQKKESPSIIDDLLDVGRTMRKPQYLMAGESPLVLQNCEFEGVTFFCPTGSARQVLDHWEILLKEHAIASAMLKSAQNHLSFCYSLNGSEELLRKDIPHIPLLCRPTEPSYEERRTKTKSKIKSNLKGQGR